MMKSCKLIELFLLTCLTIFFSVSSSAQINEHVNKSREKVEFKLGLENLTGKLLKNLNKKRIGLITNQTGIDSEGNRSIDVLLSKGIKIEKIFAPEHGFSGNAHAGEKIDNTIDKKTKIPIVSLYDGDSKFKKFEKEDLDDIDAFIFDIQDSGIRHYTYISILYKTMEIASEHSKQYIVLDRPNPLGIVMEGPLVAPEFISFISIAPIPLRHAMTIGELAKFFNEFLLKKKLDLVVVPMQGYKRTRGLNNKLPVYLSPNIKNINACLNYSFLGILGEISPLNVLTGTKHAFTCIMLDKKLNLPMEKWYKLKSMLAKQNISSYLFRYFKKEKNQNFIGLKIKINDINKFSNMQTILKILDFFKNEEIKLNFSKSFSKVMGTEKLQSLIENKISLNLFVDQINDELRNFFNKVKDLLIYYPLPKIKEIDAKN